MRTLWKDLRYGCRMLRKDSGSTLVAALALTLGIGANSAIFSVVNGVLLRPLRYKDPERLVILWECNPGKGIREFYVTPPNYKDWREQNRPFEQMAAFRVQPAALTGGGLPERIEAAAVSPSIFEMLGAPVALGRAFVPDEGEPGRNRVAVLSYGLWQRRFGGDPGILGKTLTLDGVPHAITGVTARGFRLLDTPSELWVPYALDARELKERGFHTLKVIARLRPGITLPQAREQMQSVARGLEQRYAETNAGWSVNPVLLREQFVGNIRPTLYTLAAAVCFVLLIACSNAANLLLSRAGKRQKEIAVRTAMGASQLRVIRQLLTESVVLSLGSGLLGLLLAYGGVSVLVAIGPANLPRIEEISVDGRVLGFTLLVSVVTGCLFGLGPAIAATRSRLHDILKAAGRSSMASLRGRQIRNALVVCEIALSVVLLVGAGLMMRSFLELQGVRPGFRTDHVLTMELALPEARYSGLRVASFYRQLIERVQALPGVRLAGVARNLPLSGSDPSLNFVIEHRPVLPSAEQPRARYRAVSSDYFAAMGIALVKGRYFTPSDAEGAPAVAIINESMARRFWPGEDPMGKRMKAGFDDSPWCTIAGIVSDVKHAGLDAETNAEMYYPYLQVPPPLMNFVEGTMTLVVRTAGEPLSMTRAVREQVRALDPDQPVFHVQTMEELLHGSMAQPRFRALLLAVFAALALALATIGLFGVVSYSVSQRANELGAQKSDLLRLVLGEGARLAAGGVMLGLAVAFALARALAKMLYGVTPGDPLTFTAIPLLLLAVAILAAYIPARRATRTDPAVALRYE